jgi:uncharacterized membrane protein
MKARRLVRSEKRIDWKAPVFLLVLSIVPVLAGLVRLAGLVEGGPIKADNARFFAAPMPIALHLLSATLFCILGAFQFASEFRRRSPAWHRIAGRLLVPCGLLAGLSGVWMTVTYPIDPLQQGGLLFCTRILFGSAMMLSLVLSLSAILRRDIALHRAWIIRAYAIGQGAGTQVFVFLPWMLISGAPSGLLRDVLMSIAWVINLALAEWIIRRQPPLSRSEPRQSSLGF